MRLEFNLSVAPTSPLPASCKSPPDTTRARPHQEIRQTCPSFCSELMNSLIQVVSQITGDQTQEHRSFCKSGRSPHQPLSGHRRGESGPKLGQSRPASGLRSGPQAQPRSPVPPQGSSPAGSPGLRVTALGTKRERSCSCIKSNAPCEASSCGSHGWGGLFHVPFQLQIILPWKWL